MSLRPNMRPKRPYAGRPSKNPNKANFRESEVYKLLMGAFPQYNYTTKGDIKCLDIDGIALMLDLSRQSLYKWFEGGRISDENVKLLIEKANGRLTAASFANLFFN